MRLFPVLLATLPLLAAGCGQCGPTTRSTIDVPVTLMGVRALHHPPDSVVEIAHRQRVPGGTCKGAAICLLLIPVDAFEDIFPARWDEARITDHGNILYEGHFRTDGELIDLTSRKNGLVRSIAVLPLEKLKRRPIVEVARAPLLPGGQEGVFVKTPILAQIDLVADYRRALAGEDDVANRAALLVEASAWLGEEALPFLRQILSGESDEGAARTVEGLCKKPGEEQGRQVRAEMLASLSVKPGPRTSAAGLSCAVLSHDGQAARPFARALGGWICEAPDASIARDVARAFGTIASAASEAKADAELQAASAEAATVLPLCTRLERKVRLQLMTGQHVATADLEPALADEDLGEDIASSLDSAQPEVRAALFAALPGRKLDRGLLDALARKAWIPNARELETLAPLYCRTEDNLVGFKRDRDLLSMFARAKGDPARVIGARKLIEAAVAIASESDRPRLRAALLLLGDRTQALPASRGLEGVKAMFDPRSDAQDAIITALQLAGCDDDVILAAARKASSVKDDDRGALCPG